MLDISKITALKRKASRISRKMSSRHSSPRSRSHSRRHRSHGSRRQHRESKSTTSNKNKIKNSKHGKNRRNTSKFKHRNKNRNHFNSKYRYENDSDIQEAVSKSTSNNKIEVLWNSFYQKVEWYYLVIFYHLEILLVLDAADFIHLSCVWSSMGQYIQNDADIFASVMINYKKMYIYVRFNST